MNNFDTPEVVVPRTEPVGSKGASEVMVQAKPFTVMRVDLPLDC